MDRCVVRTSTMLMLAGALASPLAGQGSSVYTQSACVSARGGAAVAAPCDDASSVYYNPALLSLLPSTVSAGATAIYNTGSFTYDTTGVVVDRETGVPLAPQLYASYRFGSGRLAAGLGVWAPYGLGIEWPRDFEGRFISWKTSLRGIYIQPTIAYQLVPGRLAIGGGPQVVSGGIELNQHVDAPVANDTLAALGIPLGTDIASASLSGSGVGFGGHVGAYYRVSDRLALGARYMLPVTVDLSGDATFEQLMNPHILLRIPDATGATATVPLDAMVQPLFVPGGPLSDQDVEASLTFPAQAVVGLRFDATADLDLSLDYQWTGWSSFDEVVADFQGGAPSLTLPFDYSDTHTFRTGVAYAASPRLELRGGFGYNTAASPDESVTPILPEAERQFYTAGLGYRTGGLRADVYYNYIDQADRRGRVRSELPPSVVREGIDQLNIGVYSSTAHLLGITLSYVFGDRR